MNRKPVSHLQPILVAVAAALAIAFVTVVLTGGPG